MKVREVAMAIPTKTAQPMLSCSYCSFAQHHITIAIWKMTTPPTKAP